MKSQQSSLQHSATLQQINPSHLCSTPKPACRVLSTEIMCIKTVLPRHQTPHDQDKLVSAGTVIGESLSTNRSRYPWLLACHWRKRSWHARQNKQSQRQRKVLSQLFSFSDDRMWALSLTLQPVIKLTWLPRQELTIVTTTTHLINGNCFNTMVKNVTYLDTKKKYNSFGASTTSERRVLSK